MLSFLNSYLSPGKFRILLSAYSKKSRIIQISLCGSLSSTQGEPTTRRPQVVKNPAVNDFSQSAPSDS